MRKLLKTLSVVLVGAGLLSLPVVAEAQELTLRLEPGVAFPVGSPQDNRFDVGGALAIKPELTLAHYVGVGPSVSVETFPSTISGVDGPTAWGFGGFVRVKRPHDYLNTGTGFGAVSPWVDADLQYIRTGPLDRFGFAVAVGAQVPTSASRWLWVGPFLRLEDVNQNGGQPGFDTSNSKTLIAGLSFEFGAKVAAPVALTPPPVVVVVEKKAPPPPEYVLVEKEIDLAQVEQFAWDSPVLTQNYQNLLLTGIARVKSEHAQIVAARVEGHASSEGTVPHNDVLSAQRAESVAKFLAAHGVDRGSITTISFGSRVPVASNATEAGRVANRRTNTRFTVKFTVSQLKEVK